MTMAGGTGVARGRRGVSCGGYWRGVRCVFWCFFLLFYFTFCSSRPPLDSSDRPIGLWTAFLPEPVLDSRSSP
ncbi:hypothetical protein DFH09DRAFT_1178731 [Mycena vulgaris]|nr:hypothetical protein DFH09DRAFT_1178731 [Mycena vulgaris]